MTVLLVDDQAIIAEAVRRMLAAESDIRFHYCTDPTKAIEQANAIGPTVILQDLVMPELDGLTLVKFFRANPKTREVPMIVLSTKEEPTIKAQAFAIGANDYLVKLPDKLELIARIRYHSKGYIAQLERNEAYRKLAESQKQLADEVAQAAKYVCSLLPAPIQTGPVRVDWRFVPSTQLGGDSFGYHWLDDEHFAVYLLDVSGHGVGASLLSVSALNVLRSQSLPNTDFRDPGAGARRAERDLQDGAARRPVLHHLVRRLSQEHAATGLRRRRPSAGLALRRSRSGENSREAPRIRRAVDWHGAGTAVRDANHRLLGPVRSCFCSATAFSRLSRPTARCGSSTTLSGLSATLPPNEPVMDRLLSHVQGLHGSNQLEDDFSIAEAIF